jgi:hypothetical protein
VGGPEAGRLDYVAPGAQPRGDALGSSAAVSADGEVLAFRSADPRLDPQGGVTNGGFPQYYRYGQADRSLVCVSCPPGGSAPRGEVVGTAGPEEGALREAAAFGASPLSADGGVLAFNSPSALVDADQNTVPAGGNAQHGQDVYEWREGRALLVSDGIGEWAGGPGGEGAPTPASVSPSGRDVFFFANAQYTPDALDGYRRLYDARLGGGIRFAREPRPCPLEACQGTPGGTPPASAPGSATFHGAGNPAPGGRCGRLARRAARLARRARAARHGRARGLSRRARGLAKRAKRCRARAARERGRGG